MKPIHRYTLPEEIVKDLRFVARFELHEKESPDCKINTSLAWKEEVRRRIADRIFKVLIEQEMKKIINPK